MLEAVNDELCLLDVLEAMCCVLLCTLCATRLLKVPEGLEVPEVMCCVPLCLLEVPEVMYCVLLVCWRVGCVRWRYER